MQKSYFSFLDENQNYQEVKTGLAFLCIDIFRKENLVSLEIHLPLWYRPRAPLPRGHFPRPPFVNSTSLEWNILSWQIYSALCLEGGKNKIGKQTEKEFPCQLTVSLIDRNSRREDGTRHSWYSCKIVWSYANLLKAFKWGLWWIEIHFKAQLF